VQSNGFGDRDIGIYYTSKGRKLAQVSMIIKDVPGVQSQVLSILANHGIDLKLGWFDTTETGVTGRYSAFVDITDWRYRRARTSSSTPTSRACG
jgi:hypothetical protein